MFIIAGLGNPDEKYQGTRHNVGFNVIDLLVKKYGLSFNENKKFNALECCFNLNGEKVIFVKPLTYMNLSGSSVALYVNYYNIELSDILIIHDDLDMVLGKIRFVFDSSSGGHNGLKNIELHLGTQMYKRIKIGISNNKSIDTKDYVLGKMSREDESKLDTVIDTVMAILDDYFQLSFDALMSKYNHK